MEKRKEERSNNSFYNAATRTPKWKKRREKRMSDELKSQIRLICASWIIFFCVSVLSARKNSTLFLLFSFSKNIIRKMCISIMHHDVRTALRWCAISRKFGRNSSLFIVSSDFIARGPFTDRGLLTWRTRLVCLPRDRALHGNSALKPSTRSRMPCERLDAFVLRLTATLSDLQDWKEKRK